MTPKQITNMDKKGYETCLQNESTGTQGEGCNGQSPPLLVEGSRLIRRLDSRVILWPEFGGVVSCPTAASIGQERLVGDGGRNFALTLDKLKGKTLTGVPGDVAVHEPAAWVVALPGQNEVAVTGQ
jgi:hypothetical protein